jgi:uncharacterized protein (TIRG00374 family)
MGLLARHWRIATSVLLSLGILVLAVLNWEWLLEAFTIVERANPFWLVAAAGTILLSYFITSQVLTVALHSLGYNFGLLRTWAIAMVAVVFSQSVPAGGVGSYAFLVSICKRRGVPSGQATLVASLEAISYVGTMLLIFLFSLIYLTIQGLGAGPPAYFAAGAALLVVGSVIFVLTRSEEQLTQWLLTIKNRIAKLLRREWSDRRVLKLVGELSYGRSLFASQRRDVVLLMLIQATGLLGHSFAMLMVFWSLGVHPSFFIVVSAFGIALITSTFNVLPGGGGTVEAAMVAVLRGVGVAAVATTIIFRLLNFWLLLPVAAGCYYWLMHEPPPEHDTQSSDTESAQEPESVPHRPTLNEENNGRDETEEAVLHASSRSE